MEEVVLKITGREQYLIEIALKQFADRIQVENNRKPSYQNGARLIEVNALYHKVLHSSTQCI